MIASIWSSIFTYRYSYPSQKRIFTLVQPKVLKAILDVMSVGQGHLFQTPTINEIFNNTIEKELLPTLKEVRRLFDKIPDFVKATFTSLSRRRQICITKGQRLVLMPDSARAGDVLCVLFGARTPVALRPVDDGTYQVLGGCYVPGFMFGKAVDMMKMGTVKSQQIDLV